MPASGGPESALLTRARARDIFDAAASVGQRLGVRDLERKYENSKCCHHYRADGSHIDASGEWCRHRALTALVRRFRSPHC
jgi:hypothetical protein